jgi:predicted ATPase
MPLWVLGYTDQALQRSHDALTLAHELSQPSALAFALTQAGSFHQYRREAQAAQERAAAVIALAREHGFTQWLVGGMIQRGWALAEQGQSAEGMAQMHQGLAAWRATGAKQPRLDGLALLAEAYGRAGQAAEGLSGLVEALGVVNQTGERLWEAELYRLKGELPLAVSSDHHAEAEACFQQALDIARRQQAKSWELRAAMSLARLWQRQGQRAEARQLLAEVYGWLTEGFDTADLQEAKALLEELS